MFRVIFLLLMSIVSLLPFKSLAQWFNPAVSIMCSYTFSQNTAQLHEGIFSFRSSKWNPGFMLENRFRFRKGFFINAGIRYNQYGTSVYGENQMPDFFNKPKPFSWEKRYESIVLPVALGKEFIVNGRWADAYVGFSGGLFMTSFMKTKIAQPIPDNTNNHDVLYLEIIDNANQTPNYFYLGADMGCDFQLIKKIPGLSLGFLSSVQLNRTKPYQYQAVERNVTQSREYLYDANTIYRFINTSLLLKYSFGKKNKEKRSSYECIEK